MPRIIDRFKPPTQQLDPGFAIAPTQVQMDKARQSVGLDSLGDPGFAISPPNTGNNYRPAQSTGLMQPLGLQHGPTAIPQLTQGAMDDRLGRELEETRQRMIAQGRGGYGAPAAPATIPAPMDAGTRTRQRVNQQANAAAQVPSPPSGNAYSPWVESADRLHKAYIQRAGNLPGVADEINAIREGRLPGYAAQHPMSRAFAVEAAQNGINFGPGNVRPPQERVDAANSQLAAATQARQQFTGPPAPRNAPAPQQRTQGNPRASKSVQYIMEKAARDRAARSGASNPQWTPEGLGVADTPEEIAGVRRAQALTAPPDPSELRAQEKHEAWRAEQGKPKEPGKPRQWSLNDLWNFVEPEVKEHWAEQSPENVIAAYQRALQRARELEKAPQAAPNSSEAIAAFENDADIARPTNREEWMAIPKGKRYLHPDGSTRVKQ